MSVSKDIENKPFALIVEDDRGVAALFRHVLDMAGFQTEIVLHGQVAVERLANRQPDIVLLDLSLPGVSGDRILDLIRGDARLVHTKIIVITGHPQAIHGLRKQPDLVLLKPVSIEQLTALVKRVNLSKKAPKAVPIRQKPLDGRTGLYNRPFFINRLESSIKRAGENDLYRFAVLLFRLEHIGRGVNQNALYDRETTLREVAGALRSILRPTDTLARFEPDTFYILIENVPDGDILVQIANRIQDRLYRKILDVENKIRIPLRIGILLCDREYVSADVVLNDAGHAQMLAIAQGDEYSRYYYQISPKKK